MLATTLALVSTESPGRTTVDPVTSRPFTHTPPSLRKTAEAGAASFATSDRGHRATINQQRKLRKADTLTPRLSFHNESLQNRSGKGVESSISTLDAGGTRVNSQGKSDCFPTPGVGAAGYA